MDPIFSELRSMLHAPTIPFLDVEFLLQNARSEVWDYARPLLARLTHGNVWSQASQPTGAQWSDDVLDVCAQMTLDEGGHANLTHGVRVGPYARVLWRTDVRRTLHLWMVSHVRAQLDGLEALSLHLEPHLHAVHQWCLGLATQADLKRNRQALTQQWRAMSQQAQPQAVADARLPAHLVARQEMMAWGRMGAPSKQGTLSPEELAAQHHMLRQQWITWLALHAMDTSKVPLVSAFAELLSMLQHVDVLTQPLRWEEHPLRVLVFVQGMMGEVLREDPEVSAQTQQALSTLRSDLGLWLNAAAHEPTHTLPSAPTL